MRHAESHATHCTCLTCKLDQFKKQNPNSLVVPDSFTRDSTSWMIAALAGSGLTLLGMSWFRKWKSAAYGSLACSSPAELKMSNEPMVWVNNATDQIIKGVTADPSMGIFYPPSTGFYEINLVTNPLYRSADLSSNSGDDLSPVVIRFFIVKNGLPNDSSAILLSGEQGLVPNCPQIFSLHGIKLLRAEDYIQVFALAGNSSTTTCTGSDTATSSSVVSRLSFEFTLRLVESQPSP